MRCLRPVTEDEVMHRSELNGAVLEYFSEEGARVHIPSTDECSSSESFHWAKRTKTRGQSSDYPAFRMHSADVRSMNLTEQAL